MNFEEEARSWLVNTLGTSRPEWEASLAAKLREVAAPAPAVPVDEGQRVFIPAVVIRVGTAAAVDVQFELGRAMAYATDRTAIDRNQLFQVRGPLK